MNTRHAKWIIAALILLGGVWASGAVLAGEKPRWVKLDWESAEKLCVHPYAADVADSEQAAAAIADAEVDEESGRTFWVRVNEDEGGYIEAGSDEVVEDDSYALREVICVNESGNGWIHGTLWALIEVE